MKATVEAHVAPWTAPTKVHFDEGLKLPIACVGDDVIEHLCRKWLADVCNQKGISFDVTFAKGIDT